MTKFVIELDAIDTYRVLCLLYYRAAFSQGKDYYLKIIEQIEAAIDAQTVGGVFFQCSACTDQVMDHANDATG
jgi:hypothetical protein